MEAQQGITYAALNGTYTKIGRMVMVRGGFALSNKGSSTGSAYVQGCLLLFKAFRMQMQQRLEEQQIFQVLMDRRSCKPK
jgi:hypothetical protein